MKKLATYLVVFITYNILLNGGLYQLFHEDGSVSGQSGLFMAMTILALGIHQLANWTVKGIYGEKL